MKDEYNNDEVQLIEIARIRILNPRFRERKKFEAIIDSIRQLGLKKPIQVSIRSGKDEGPDCYDLVCGQGRIEAYLALGYTTIPAVIVDIPKEERLLRSLAENMARRFPNPADLIEEIQRLKDQGYSNVAIGEKLGMSDSNVGGFMSIKNAGEERLLQSAIRGVIPLGIAIEIARAEGIEAQRELLKAYENKQLNGASIRTVKRLIDQRQFLGKDLSTGRNPRRTRASAESLVNAYRKESQRQKLLVRKAKVCEAKLVFLVQAFTTLFGDDNFANLLKAEGLATMPKFLAERCGKVGERK